MLCSNSNIQNGEAKKVNETSLIGQKVIIVAVITLRTGYRGFTPLRQSTDQKTACSPPEFDSGVVENRGAIHGPVKTSVGRSQRPSLAFHLATWSGLFHASYKRKIRTAASASRFRSDARIFTLRTFIPS